MAGGRDEGSQKATPAAPSLFVGVGTSWIRIWAIDQPFSAGWLVGIDDHRLQPSDSAPCGDPDCIVKASSRLHNIHRTSEEEHVGN